MDGDLVARDFAYNVPEMLDHQYLIDILRAIAG